MKSRVVLNAIYRDDPDGFDEFVNEYYTCDCPGMETDRFKKTKMVKNHNRDSFSLGKFLYIVDFNITYTSFRTYVY